MEVQEKRKKSHHMKKIMVLVLLILAGVLVYLLVGAVIPFVHQPEISEETRNAFDRNDFVGKGSSGERAKIISQNGEALEERIRLISQAEERIVLSTFEFHSDTSGKQVIAALMDVADRGVEVSVIVDGFPCLTSMWGNAYFRALYETENVDLRVYNPVRIWEPWKLMGRLHDKYLVVDERDYIMGGRNNYDFFLGDQKGYKNYDWDVMVYSSEADRSDASVRQILTYFEEMWNHKETRSYAKEPFQANSKKASAAKEELHTLYQTMQKEHPDWFEKESAEQIRQKTVPIKNARLVANPTTIYAKEPIVYYTLTELMKGAEKEVTFHTPYIICNDWMLERLKEACDSVESVEMMTNSIANNGNPFGAMDYKHNKGKILDTGVQIREYDGGVSYHGKCMVIDDNLSAVGSFNWDMRSAYLDTEMMLVVDSEELNAQLAAEMEKYEEKTLTVIDEEQSIPPEGEEAQEITAKKRRRIVLLSLVRWARFLM